MPGMNKLPTAPRAQMLNLLCEGSSMRAVSPLTDTSINPVAKLLVDADKFCAGFDDAKVRGVKARRVQVDEIWSFCYANARNVKTAKAAPEAAGEVWTWTAIERREALWAIRALRDEPLPLFIAASTRAKAAGPEIEEPAVALKAMTAGREVVEDYSHVGLTLRQHPVTFLRCDLVRRKMVTCADAAAARDGRSVTVAGLVLVRQKPGSAKLFITIEDETGTANLVIWPALFETQRRVILSAGMLAVNGRIQREGAVVHIVAYRLHDLSDALASIGEREAGFPRKTIKVRPRDFR